MLANTTWWPCASRLALSLTKAGCEVSAIYPVAGHPLAKTGVIRDRYPYRSVDPVNSLAEAIGKAKPRLIVPCDDRAVEHLHQLHARETASGSQIGALIECSLGAPASYPIVTARYPLFRIARELGLPVPDTALASGDHALNAWAAQHEFPWVLKADGTWGGHGTRFASTQSEAEGVARQMRRPLSAGRALKRLLVDRDPYWFLPWRDRSVSQVIVQARIDGFPANCAVVCWQGKVLAGIAVEVLCAQGETGSATVVRVVDSPAMIRAAERLAEYLGLSGFVGLDFMIETATGIPYLIEMNPRVTPLCHLQLGAGRDLISAITAKLIPEPQNPAPASFEQKVIAYFPQAWHRTTPVKLLAASYPDIPCEEPALVQELLRPPWPDRSPLARLAARVRHLTPLRKATSGIVFQPADSAMKAAGELKCQRVDPQKLPAVVPLRASGSKDPLLILHDADGQVSRFHRLVRHLEPERPVYAVLPQSLLGEPVMTRMEQLASFYLERIQTIFPQGPYRLLGGGFGVYLGLEMARQLCARGEPAVSLGLVNVRPNAGDTLRARVLRRIYAGLELMNLPIPCFLRDVSELNRFAVNRYVPRAFSGTISLFRTPASLRPADAACDLFARLAGRGIENYDVSGDPEEIFEEPHLRCLAAQVDRWLAKS